MGQHVRGTEDGFRIRGVPDPPARRPHRGARRPPDRDARRHRGRRLAGRRRGSTTPTASPSASPASSTCSPGSTARRRSPASWGDRGCAVIVAIDGPAGAGKSSVARALAARARVPLPRHGGDVPGAHLARAPPGRRARRRACARGARPRRAGRRSAPAAPSRSRPRTSRPGSASRRSTRPSPSSPPTSEVREVMRARQRALGAEGDSVIEGRDIGVVVVAERGAEDLAARPTLRCGLAAATPSATASTPRRLRPSSPRRDERDASNTHHAPDAVDVDTTELTLDAGRRAHRRRSSESGDEGRGRSCGSSAG